MSVNRVLVLSTAVFDMNFCTDWQKFGSVGSGSTVVWANAGCRRMAMIRGEKRYMVRTPTFIGYGDNTIDRAGISPGSDTNTPKKVASISWPLFLRGVNLQIKLLKPSPEAAAILHQ